MVSSVFHSFSFLLPHVASAPPLSFTRLFARYCFPLPLSVAVVYNPIAPPSPDRSQSSSPREVRLCSAYPPLVLSVILIRLGAWRLAADRPSLLVIISVTRRVARCRVTSSLFSCQPFSSVSVSVCLFHRSASICQVAALVSRCRPPIAGSGGWFTSFFPPPTAAHGQETTHRGRQTSCDVSCPLPPPSVFLCHSCLCTSVLSPHPFPSE